MRVLNRSFLVLVVAIAPATGVWLGAVPGMQSISDEHASRIVGGVACGYNPTNECDEADKGTGCSAKSGRVQNPELNTDYKLKDEQGTHCGGSCGSVWSNLEKCTSS
jgi:hypothetical protein